MRKWLLITALVIGVILVLLAALLGMAQQAVVNQPAVEGIQRQDLPTDNPWIKVRMDEGIFTLFAALNASGFDRENFDQPYHPVRKLVRERLAGKRFAGQERLRAELKLLNTYNFVVWALHYGPPPAFARVEPRWTDSGVPAFLFYDLDSQLRQFYEEMEIAALWQEVRPHYEQEAARYQNAAGQAIQDVLDYARMQNVPLKQMIVIPNLLSAHWNGNGPTVGETAYVVIGPTGDQPDTALIQHEALHSIAGPLVEANMHVIDEKQADSLYAELRKRVPSSYGSWEIIVEEQVVRALSCRLMGPDCEQYMLNNDEAEGFLLERTLVNSLNDYEQGTGTLAEFMPEMLRSLNSVPLPLSD